MPQSPCPSLLDWPTIEIPRKFTVSILSVTVITISLMVESVTEDMEPARFKRAGTFRFDLFFGRWRNWRETEVWSVSDENLEDEAGSKGNVYINCE